LFFPRARGFGVFSVFRPLVFRSFRATVGICEDRVLVSEAQACETSFLVLLWGEDLL